MEKLQKSDRSFGCYSSSSSSRWRRKSPIRSVKARRWSRRDPAEPPLREHSVFCRQVLFDICLYLGFTDSILIEVLFLPTDAAAAAAAPALCACGAPQTCGSLTWFVAGLSGCRAPSYRLLLLHSSRPAACVDAVRAARGTLKTTTAF